MSTSILFQVSTYNLLKDYERPRTMSYEAFPTTATKQVIGADRWVNQQTGEIIETQTLTKEVKDVDIGFEKLWIGHILETIDEVGNAKVKVLFWLLKNKDQQNMVRATIDTIAEKTGASRATVGRLMAALRRADVVRLEYGGRWLLNPSVIFKGSHSRRMNVLIRYKSMEQQELPLDEPIQSTQQEPERMAA
jgi:DNA-binding transcriptional ArsR family regulator